MSTENKTTAYIEVTGADAALVTSADIARQTRDALLSKAKRGTVISGPASAEAALALLKEIKAFTDFVEDSRVAVKKPVDKIAADIQAMARDLSSGLLAEAKRIGTIYGAWQQAENEKAERIWQEAWQKEQDILAEAQREQAARAQEAADKANELLRKASVARTPENAAKYEASAAAVQAVAAQQEQEQSEKVEAAVIQTRVAAVVAAPAKPIGASVRQTPDFEIEDIVALYEACPVLVNLEPNRAAILNAIKGLHKGQSLPGVKHWWKVATSVSVR